MLTHKPAKKRVVHCRFDTFGNDKCTRVLAEILNEIDDPKLTAKVSRYFHTKSKIYKDLSTSEHRKYIYRLVCSEHATKIENTTWPPKVKSFVKNCLDAQAKKYLG